MSIFGPARMFNGRIYFPYASKKPMDMPEPKHDECETAKRSMLMEKQYDKEDINKIIGKNIILERKLRGITRDELAEILDISTSHMGLMERGERGVHALHFAKLAGFFDVPVNNFFTGGKKEGLSALNTRDPELQASQETISTLSRALNEFEVNFVATILRGLLAMREKQIAFEKLISISMPVQNP